MAVGSEFWTHGDFFRWSQLQKLKDTADPDVGDDMPCRMLIVREGRATCYIELIYGRDAKPEVCRTYPWLECHRQQKTYRGRGVCSQNED